MMGQKPNDRRGRYSRSEIIVIILLIVMLLFLIVGTVFTVLGNLKIIYWPSNLNNVLLTVVVPALSVIIALGQWLHTSISSDKKEEKHNLPEQNIQTADVAMLNTSLVLADTSEKALTSAKKTDAIVKFTSDDIEQTDMGEAPHVENFYGRMDEIKKIKHWIVDEHCRLVSIIGMGGIGKTSLVAKLIDQEQQTFSKIFWRRLLNAPPFEHVLQDCLQFLTRGQQIPIPQEVDGQMRLLVKQLQKRRCLIILDNAEAILKSGSSAAEYKDGYEQYGKLITLLGESRHQSCLLVTSREQLKEINWLEGEGSSVHTYHLRGLNIDDARAILKNKGLSGEERSLKTLVERLAGNPQMLMIVSLAIRESYGGNISKYLDDISLNEHPDLRKFLNDQFARLSLLEQQVIYWLAIEREAISLQTLRDNSVQPVSKGRILEALEALQRRSLIEQGIAGSFTLQPAIMEVVTDRFNELVVQEVITGKPDLFARHALLKSQAKAFVRESQFQLILNVIAQKLFTMLGRRKLEEKFRQRLVVLRGLPEQPDDYEVGNILNLLVQTGYNLRGFDFSHLVVRQAYLQEANLPEVNFSYANLSTSVFTDNFGSILSVALSPYSDFLAAGTVGGEIRVWDTTSGLPLKTLRGHTNWVSSVAFSPDGKTLASGSDDQTVRLWNVTSGQCLNTFHDHINEVKSVAFSPDGKTLASGSDDQTVRLWDVTSGQCLNTLRGHTNAIWSVAFSPDGKILASGSFDQTVRLWRIDNGQCLNTFHGHTNEVWSVAFSPDGEILASGGYDQTIRLWDVTSGQCLNTLHDHTDAVWRVAFSSDGKTLASGSSDQTVRLWNVTSGQCLNILHGHANAVRSVAFSSDGKTLASGSSDQTVRLWDVVSGQCLNTLHGHANAVRSVAFSPDGKTLASGGYDQTIRLWDVVSGQCLNTFRDHINISSVAFSPDGKTLASGYFNHTVTVRLWDVTSGQCLNTLHGHTNSILSVAFSPDGKTLASGGYDQTIRLWSVVSGQCLNTLHGHSNLIWSVAFSPDGKLLISGSDDQTVCLWKISNGQCLNTFHGHTHWVRSVAFNPDGKTLASGCIDGVIKLWNRQNSKCLHTLRSDRPYEHMNITRVQGLTEVQKNTLKLLGADEEEV
ncbi:NACHT and WD40 repeat domain-containing protein [Dictyobacter aurantiacus]|uniref:NACHT and WD40 repeat domain-containing protein n=1 Tax=Dictyobacter aurantiacus TaxID=1936993 RepID=UPI000F82E102|nr:NB-ARC domain-containing protein [Dictyobacter aurantiacus]